MRELPREPLLQLRMLIAGTLALLFLMFPLALAIYVAVTLPDGWKGALAVLGMPGMFILIGMLAARQPFASWRSRKPEAADDARVRAALDRLALVAGIPSPQAEVLASRAPVSWTTAYPWKPARVHVSTGLLDRLEDRELQAVLAHELAHLVHRDALLMTLLAGPPAQLLRGIRAMFDEDPFRAVIASIGAGWLVILPAAVMLLLSRIVGRARELAADRAAAVLTGSPAAVAAALLAVDEELKGTPKLDLRRAASLDAFNFVPARPPRRLLRPWATHPPTAARVKRMQRFEAALQRS